MNNVQVSVSKRMLEGDDSRPTTYLYTLFDLVSNTFTSKLRSCYRYTFDFVMLVQALILATFCAVYAQEYEENTTHEPHPYSFSFVAGRYPGHVDRTRAEYGDGNGIVRGLYTYVDPRQEIRAVEYTADKEGFHPILNKPAAVDTPVVAAAKSRHLKLFNKIAKNNEFYQPKETASVEQAKRNHAILYEKIAQDHARIAAELETARIEAERREYFRKQNQEVTTQLY